MAIQPYLFFDGQCDEAIEFYRRAVGAEVKMLMRYKDNPEPQQPSADCPPVNPENVMHAQLTVAGSTILVSDGRAQGKPKFDGFSLSLTVATEADAERFFNALTEGGQVQMSLTRTFFSPRFGMVADRFGVWWMVYVTPGA